ncbi:MAG: aldehyde dehydrogenase family protein [Coriobacteriia bacterium]|nr:aldehyde dehydrogenase family protein [Coriobacteriia bacterium]
MVTKVHKMPYGNCLIISPFNFPVLLTFGVLAACISGGNTAVLKCSSKSSESTKVMKKLIRDAFPQKYITVIDGGHDVADMCLDQRFDKIFYTGSPKVGVHVMQKAAKNLTPVALELGGETGNWCVIRKDANLKDAARKIAFFKACNSGQICININQIAVAREVAEPFIEELKKAFEKQLGPNAIQNDEYPKLITKAAYDKCDNWVKKYKSKLVYGGQGDGKTHKYNPTILYPMSADDDICKQELFNPILPIVPFADNQIDKVLKMIASREHGLALYLFTSDIA